MFTFHVDLGQVILAGMIGIIGYLVKRMVDQFGMRLDKHEDILFTLSGQIQKVIGFSQGFNDRRKNQR